MDCGITASLSRAVILPTTGFGLTAQLNEYFAGLARLDEPVAVKYEE